MADDESRQPRPKKDHEPPAGAETTARWTGGAKPLGYTATAKWLVLRKKEKPSAEIFSVSYVADGGDQTRPVAFVFNGGPGASSAYLHMGAVGPQRVDFPADGTLPELPPQLVQNESSWLAFADLVFVDPVGTGFSRIIEPDKKGEQQGARSPSSRATARSRIRTSTSARSATSSRCASSWRAGCPRTTAGARPVFIAGESYGGYRVGRLVRMLQEETGIGLNGAILISPALELTALVSERLQRDERGSTCCRRWRAAPPFTVARARSRPGRSLDEVRAGAEEFASGDYATFLIRGASLGVPERERTLERLADFLGLPLELVTRAEGRISPFVFARELLRDERKVVGFYDVTITGTDPFPDRRSTGRAGSDPRRNRALPTPRRSTGSSARRSASRPTASTAS